MNPEQLGFVLGSGWLGLKLSSLLIESAGRILYDIGQIKISKKHAVKRTKRIKYATIVVEVSGPGDESDLENCLESIAKQAYPKFEVMVVGERLNAEDKKTVRKIQKTYPRLKIMNTVDSSGRNSITRKHARTKNEIIVSITRQDRLSQDALDQINRHFLRGQSGNMTAAMRILPDRSLVGLAQEYEALRVAGARVVGLCLNRQDQAEVKSITKNADITGVYAEDVVVLRRSKTAYRSVVADSIGIYIGQIEAMRRLSGAKKILNAIIGFSAMIEPFAIAYFVYLAIAFDRPEPLVLGWGLGVFSLVFYAYSSKYLSFAQKLRLILLAPVGYIELLLLSLTRIVAFLGYLAKWLKNDWQSWKPQYVRANP